MNAPSNAPPPKEFAWSWSALNNYETCAKKYYHAAVAKDFKEKSSEAMTWGYAVHSAMARNLMHGEPLPAEMKQWEHWLKWAREPFDPEFTVLRVEERMAITEHMQPCDYFDKAVPVWFRMVADVLKVRGPAGRLVDWKTGKPDTFFDTSTNTWQSNSDQLKVSAACIFASFPMVHLITLDYVWLQQNYYTRTTIARDDLPLLWQRMLPRVNAMRRAHDTGEYPPKPSGLCKAHCPVKTCAYWGKGSY